MQGGRISLILRARFADESPVRGFWCSMPHGIVRELDEIIELGGAYD